jgi:hypothetical protein
MPICGGVEILGMTVQPSAASGASLEQVIWYSDAPHTGAQFGVVKCRREQHGHERSAAVIV